MPSNTNKTRKRRKVRQKKMGSDRKKSLEKKGTTPKFPVHLAPASPAPASA
jgi:hypothetical protein